MRAIMEAEGLSHGATAKAMSAATSSVSRWANGVNEPPAEVKAWISALMGEYS